MNPRDVLGNWVDQRDQLRDEFATADPFPMVVVDGFVRPDLAAELVAEFPEISSMPRSRDYVFGSKRELSSVESGGPATRAYRDALLSQRFAHILGHICGVEVFVDPGFHGGGWHQGGDGSFLDFHVDFNVHPEHPDWLRTLNVLLYLNPGWSPEWGGELLVKASPEGSVRAIEPIYNRAVIMETSDRTFHGFRRMDLPEGITRRSVAAYAYQHIAVRTVRARTTGWAPEGAGLSKRLLARNFNWLVQAKNRLFGSGTSRNR